VAIKPIRTFDDLTKAKAYLASLMRRPNKDEYDDEIDILATLIEQFEQKNFPIDTPDPISAIKFRMEEKGLTPRQLEPYIGSRARVSEVLTGKRQLSIEMIRSLHEGLGIPYEALISDRRKKNDLNDIPDSAVQRLNDLGFELEHNEVPNFISSSLGNTAPAPVALLRKTRTQRAASKTDQGALLLWQAAVLQKSETLAAPFRHSAFGFEAIRQIARMSAKPDGPKRALRKLAELGVSLVIMPALPGTFLDGAAMTSSSGNPVIALTLRHDRVDSFWFTLLHECAHVALHLDQETLFVDDMEIRSGDQCEREADSLARDALIPPAILEQVTWGPSTSYEDLMMLAARARVHPSVVAGRWQRDHQNYKRFSRMIDRNSVRAMLQGFVVQPT
jgi:HTH-type transcriptional regulator/antitoxin HigA